MEQSVRKIDTALSIVKVEERRAKERSGDSSGRDSERREDFTPVARGSVYGR